MVGALSVTFGDSSPRGRAKSVGGGDSDEDADSHVGPAGLLGMTWQGVADN